jgi:hypothetical protein
MSPSRHAGPRDLASGDGAIVLTYTLNADADALAEWRYCYHGAFP